MVQYEFYAPFAHIVGAYEWCRIRSPSHGVFDCFIVLGATTAEPATVYVNSQLGEDFLRERFPACTRVRVGAGDLRIEEGQDGRTVKGSLRSAEGPVRESVMVFTGNPTAFPRDEEYGGTGRPVWGSAYTCWGVDLNIDARVQGHVMTPDGKVDVSGRKGIVTLGSMGRLEPLAPGAATERPPAAHAVGPSP